MSRNARKGDLSAQFFRVDGADQETGEETYLVLQAPTKPQAEKLARQQGMLISAVRVARPDDWSAAPPTPPSPEPELQPQMEVSPVQELEPARDLEYPAESPTEPSPFVDAQSPIEPAPEPLEPAPALPSISQSSQGSSAGSVFLGSIGVALIVGGVLALVLGLWPDNAVRNELQQLDFRLHEVSQTILGGMLVLGGLVVLSLAVICHLLARRTSPS